MTKLYKKHYIRRKTTINIDQSQSIEEVNIRHELGYNKQTRAVKDVISKYVDGKNNELKLDSLSAVIAAIDREINKKMNSQKAPKIPQKPVVLTEDELDKALKKVPKTEKRREYGDYSQVMGAYPDPDQEGAYYYYGALSKDEIEAKEDALKLDQANKKRDLELYNKDIEELTKNHKDYMQTNVQPYQAAKQLFQSLQTSDAVLKFKSFNELHEDFIYRIDHSGTKKGDKVVRLKELLRKIASSKKIIGETSVDTTNEEKIEMFANAMMMEYGSIRQSRFGTRSLLADSIELFFQRNLYITLPKEPDKHLNLASSILDEKNRLSNEGIKSIKPEFGYMVGKPELTSRFSATPKSQLEKLYLNLNAYKFDRVQEGDINYKLFLRNARFSFANFFSLSAPKVFDSKEKLNVVNKVLSSFNFGRKEKVIVVKNLAEMDLHQDVILNPREMEILLDSRLGKMIMKSYKKGPAYLPGSLHDQIKDHIEAKEAKKSKNVFGK